MKIPFPNEARSQKPEARSPRGGLQPSTFNLQPAQRGVALVITLIMLSVTLVMAIAFLAISRRERNSVGTNTDTTIARLAADSALAAAQVQLLANILSTNAAIYDFHLLVSTNYQNPAGLNGSLNPTNVNYDYLVGGGPLLTSDQFNTNVGNLLFLPRVPVAIYNRNTGSNEFRFYLDLNRNGRFETNGETADFDAAGVSVGTSPKTGDPEWVGILERPDAPHSANNPFVARYAFLAQPIGNSLDINAIHNESISKTVLNFPNQSGVRDGFFRNQGVGSWELNLAAFFADLNTNVWGRNLTTPTYYSYNEPQAYTLNDGVAFQDALALISYRYSFLYAPAHLATANFVMGGFANTILPRDNIDIYSDGPLQLTTTNINETLQPDNPNLSWAGANNPTNFFALTSELFDPTKVSIGFTNRLGSLGSSNASYDRYTFYRMLDQLGTDSTFDDARMNLNYNNLTATNLAGTMGATNLIAWTPADFFTNAADRLIRLHSARWRAQNFGYYTNTFGATITQAFSLTNIPVYVNGQFVYTPAVNQLLQLAANIYDASTNDIYPSVFRPRFWVVDESGFRNVYIRGYDYVASVVSPPLNTAALPPLDQPVAVTDLPLGLTSGLNVAGGNVYGVPWILGAKKKLPAFNRFYMLNNVQFTRKLQVTRDQIVAYDTAGGSSHYATNEMVLMSITNRLGWSFWNAYDQNAALGTLNVMIRDDVAMQLSNNVPRIWSAATNFFTNFKVNPNSWPGSAWTSSSDNWGAKQPSSAAFFYGTWNFAFLPESIYRFGAGAFAASVANPAWEIGIAPVPVLPQFDLRTTNRLQAFIIDEGANRLVDYVQFAGPDSFRDLNGELKDRNYNPGSTDNYMWSTNLPAGSSGAPNWGMANQINVSRAPDQYPPPPGGTWKSSPNLPSGISSGIVGKAEAAFFNGFFSVAFNFSGNTYSNLNFVQQAPYTPARTAYEYTMWQVNDPLVHYLASDLQDNANGSSFGHSDGLTAGPMPRPETVLAALENPDAKSEARYQPWGRAGQLSGSTYSEGVADKNEFNLAYRDSLVWGADFWDFPTNKYPSAGWLGRVHRGTPWQTVFLKATNILATTYTSPGGGVNLVGTNTWMIWTGNRNFYDAAHTAPEQDRLLFDVFTTSPNDNAARGALSINQTHLAAWSALLSGVVALQNITDTEKTPQADTTPILTNTIILPASVDQANAPVWQILNGSGGIAATRADTNMFPLGVFTHVGDILRVPAFTEQSPFLNRGGIEYLDYDISDELYEWLPQQTLGLLRLGTPRFVLYCYGQALRPARDGQVLNGGSNFGLVTNYQVVAESAVRVVLRVDNASGSAPHVIVESSNPLPPD